MEAETGFWIFFIAMLAVLGAVYIAPSWIGFRRNHPNRWVIFVMNIDSAAILTTKLSAKTVPKSRVLGYGLLQPE